MNQRIVVYAINYNTETSYLKPFLIFMLTLAVHSLPQRVGTVLAPYISTVMFVVYFFIHHVT